MSDDTAALILALAVENAELRLQLAEAQDLLVEAAVDAGELHARLEELQADLVEARSAPDVAVHYRRPMVDSPWPLERRPFTLNHRRRIQQR